jgi:acetylglutamate/LysW-gamma-L-alpha-aminoadipate kinase
MTVEPSCPATPRGSGRVPIRSQATSTVVVRDDHSGRIETVRGELVATLLSHGYVPVVSPPASDEHGEPVNADADRIAAALAAELDADQLVLLTGAAGVPVPSS